MNAIILAAGMGRRLKPLTDNLPKAFISIDGKPLIYRSLDYLGFAGIKTVIIVTGFMESFFKKKLGKLYHGINIIYASNKEYESTGSMYSLSQTEGLVDEDIILLESDLLYERRALNELINHNSPNVILTSAIRQTGDEVYIYYDKNGYLNNLGKNIDSKNALGELVGINKISLPFLEKLYMISKEDYNNDEKEYHYEEKIYKLSREAPVKCHMIKDLVWTEIDTYDDLERARNYVYPKIIEKEN